MYETETKLRVQKIVSFPSGDPTEVSSDPCGVSHESFNIAITENEIGKLRDLLPAITCVAGYCAHSALKKLACEACEESLILTHREMELDDFSMIGNLTRGGLNIRSHVS